MRNAAILNDSRDQATEVLSFRPSTTNYLFGSGKGWLLILVSIVTFGLALIFILPFLAWVGLRFSTTSYVLEGTRLFMREGIFIRREDEIELYRVKDITVEFSIIQQMFGNGDLTVVSTDGSGSRNRQVAKVIPYVSNARRLREQLRVRVENTRQRNRAREID